jgi:hypothetical protein
MHITTYVPHLQGSSGWLSRQSFLFYILDLGKWRQQPALDQRAIFPQCFERAWNRPKKIGRRTDIWVRDPMTFPRQAAQLSPVGGQSTPANVHLASLKV